MTSGFLQLESTLSSCTQTNMYILYLLLSFPTPNKKMHVHLYTLEYIKKNRKR
jgi:hypothetical protein